ncbi:unnamed protein product [Caenorhabditis auriculariae]|uniref:Uncharacterized protein n=1 Tax=Caenorhabditis auriculariae TaxID=2777116 RepID=A0A8S1GRC8_9PELO|nr:unnamed protein product [Caenorhabditis auriculariae]
MVPPETKKRKLHNVLAEALANPPASSKAQIAELVSQTLSSDDKSAKTLVEQLKRLQRPADVFEAVLECCSSKGNQAFLCDPIAELLRTYFPVLGSVSALDCYEKIVKGLQGSLENKFCRNEGLWKKELLVEMRCVAHCFFKFLLISEAYLSDSDTSSLWNSFVTAPMRRDPVIALLTLLITDDLAEKDKGIRAVLKNSNYSIDKGLEKMISTITENHLERLSHALDITIFNRLVQVLLKVNLGSDKNEMLTKRLLSWGITNKVSLLTANLSNVVELLDEEDDYLSPAIIDLVGVISEGSEEDQNFAPLLKKVLKKVAQRVLKNSKLMNALVVLTSSLRMALLCYNESSIFNTFMEIIEHLSSDSTAFEKFLATVRKSQMEGERLNCSTPISVLDFRIKNGLCANLNTFVSFYTFDSSLDDYVMEKNLLEEIEAFDPLKNSTVITSYRGEFENSSRIGSPLFFSNAASFVLEASKQNSISENHTIPLEVLRQVKSEEKLRQIAQSSLKNLHKFVKKILDGKVSIEPGSEDIVIRRAVEFHLMVLRSDQKSDSWDSRLQNILTVERLSYIAEKSPESLDFIFRDASFENYFVSLFENLAADPTLELGHLIANRAIFCVPKTQHIVELVQNLKGKDRAEIDFLACVVEAYADSDFEPFAVEICLGKLAADRWLEMRVTSSQSFDVLVKVLHLLDVSLRKAKKSTTRQFTAVFCSLYSKTLTSVQHYVRLNEANMETEKKKQKLIHDVARVADQMKASESFFSQISGTIISENIVNATQTLLAMTNPAMLATNMPPIERTRYKRLLPIIQKAQKRIY